MIIGCVYVCDTGEVHSIMLQQVTSVDEGIYVCELSNRLGQASAVLQLVVHPSRGEMDTNTGQFLYLFCLVRSAKMHAYTQIDIFCMCVYMHTHTKIHAHGCTRTCTRTHTHMHTHICSLR